VLKSACLFLFIFCPRLFAQVTYEQSRQASVTVGKWLSRSTGHYDFLSATPVGPKRPGKKFFIIGTPAMQTASDYGISYSQAPRDEEVTQSLNTLGFDTRNLSRVLDMHRFHVNLGFANKHDFTFSYLQNMEGLRGWGVGYKRVLYQYRYFYLTGRTQYARSNRENHFDSVAITHDLSASLYFVLVDIYAGARHAAGRVNFESDVPALRLPPVRFFSDISEIEYYYGVAFATTTNTRISFNVNQLGKELAVAGKLSFRFDSLLPSMDNWFRDPRYIRQ
jgi:hypothetical protein